MNKFNKGDPVVVVSYCGNHDNDYGVTKIGTKGVLSGYINNHTDSCYIRVHGTDWGVYIFDLDFDPIYYSPLFQALK